jgi:hypothetical protein
MGNGQKEEVTKPGKATCTIKIFEGGIQGNITLSDVIFLPNDCYNLISITKFMQSEWNLEGSEYMILSRKNDKILTFDIKLETSQGVLFAVRIKNGQESIAATINDKAAPKNQCSTSSFWTIINQDDPKHFKNNWTGIDGWSNQMQTL